MRVKQNLSYRSRQTKDDSFIIESSMKTMKKIFEESTGILLTEELIRHQIQANETVTIIELNGKPIGFYIYSIFPNRHMYWSSLILTPPAQNKGLGRQVVRHVEKEVLAKGVQIIEGHIQNTNRRALLFWKKNGFHSNGETHMGSVFVRKVLQKSN